MSFLKRLFGNAATSQEATRVATAPSRQASALSAAINDDDTPIEAQSIADLVHVDEVGDAEFYAGDLFRRRFRQAPPSLPRHFVAFYREARTRYRSIGYVHYSPFEDTFLCGGLVIDDRAYRRIPAPHRAIIKRAGGIAELMLRTTFARLAAAPAIWGYVGDKQAEEVDLRAGFRRTHHPHVMVVWNRDLPEVEKAARLERVIALGPF